MRVNKAARNREHILGNHRSMFSILLIYAILFLSVIIKKQSNDTGILPNREFHAQTVLVGINNANSIYNHII